MLKQSFFSLKNDVLTLLLFFFIVLENKIQYMCFAYFYLN